MTFSGKSKLGATRAMVAAIGLVLSVTTNLLLSGPASAENNEDFFNKHVNQKQTVVDGSGQTIAIGAGRPTTESAIVEGQNLQPMITPDSAQRMEAAADRYRSVVAQGGFPKVPGGSYRKGSKGKGPAALNQRLAMDGYLPQEFTQPATAQAYTAETERALAQFQTNMGLVSTGRIDGPTLAALNIPADLRLLTIEANIERLRVYEEGLGDRYLVVNVPSQQIETVNGGTVYSRHNAIVGRIDRPTPVVMTALSDVIFNPYWNAPASIVERDIFPKLRSGTRVLTDMNIKVFKGFGGPEIDPSTVDWNTAVADDYHFRQEPGPESAMATAKINFKSPFGIYLHDTPERGLFNTGNRFYSSGCVRVQKVDLLLGWILNGQDRN